MNDRKTLHVAISALIVTAIVCVAFVLNAQSAAFAEELTLGDDSLIEPPIELSAPDGKVPAGEDVGLMVDCEEADGEAGEDSIVENQGIVAVEGDGLVVQSSGDVSNADVSFWGDPVYSEWDTVNPDLKVTLAGQTLWSGDDYDVIYPKKLKAGMNEFTVVGKGDYTGRKTVSLRLYRGTKDVRVPAIPAQNWTGKPVEPDLAITTYTGDKLVRGKDYEVSYRDNVGVGSAIAAIEFKGDYYGSWDAYFTIVKKRLVVEGKAYAKAASGVESSGGGSWSWDGGSNLTLSNYSGGRIRYEGNSLNVKLVGSNRIGLFAGGVDAGDAGYGLYSYGDLRLYGSGSLVVEPERGQEDASNNRVTGIGGVGVTIDGTRVTVDLSATRTTHDVKAIVATALTVQKGAKVVANAPGVDIMGSTRGSVYTRDLFVYDSALSVSSGGTTLNDVNFYDRLVFRNAVVVSSGPDGIHGYSAISSATIENSDVSTKVFEACKFALKDVKGATVRKSGRSYLSSSGKDVATLTHTGVASTYANGVHDPLTKSSVSLPKESYTYTGKAIKPKPKVVLGGRTLSAGTDYAVSYKANKAVGTATVTVKGRGTYRGSKSVTFRVVPKATKVAKVASSSKVLTVTWKKQATQTTGYKVQYSPRKGFVGGNKTIAVANPKVTSKRIAKLQSKRRYYVRVRTYRKVGGKTYYSAWSAAKSVRVK